MRAVICALFVAATPFAALAQTPRDLAHLTWPSGAPAYTGHAPSEGAASAGAGTARDLARLSWPQGAPRTDAMAPRDGSAFAGHFAPIDLARLNGNSAVD